MADSDFKEQGEHVMGFFKQKGPLQRDFCEVLLYVVALWALKPASLQDILTVNQCDGIIQCSKQILFDVSYLCGIAFQAFHYILDVHGIQLHQAAFDHLFRLFFPANAQELLSAGYGFHKKFQNLHQDFPVMWEVLL